MFTMSKESGTMFIAMVAMLIIPLAGMLYTLPEIDTENVITPLQAEDMRKASASLFVVAVAIVVLTYLASVFGMKRMGRM